MKQCPPQKFLNATQLHTNYCHLYFFFSQTNTNTKAKDPEKQAMSQEKREEEINVSSTGKCPSFKFNVHAPEFVPRSATPQVPISGYFYPYLPFLGNGGYGLGPDWFYFGDKDPIPFVPDVHPKAACNSRSNTDVTQKIVKQVLCSVVSVISVFSLRIDHNHQWSRSNTWIVIFLKHILIWTLYEMSAIDTIENFSTCIYLFALKKFLLIRFNHIIPEIRYFWG